MERYRSGHNEAVLKTVWGQPHKGSNPFLSAKEAESSLVYDSASLLWDSNGSVVNDLPVAGQSRPWPSPQARTNPFLSAIKSLENTTFLRLFSFLPGSAFDRFLLNISLVSRNFSSNRKSQNPWYIRGFGTFVLEDFWKFSSFVRFGLFFRWRRKLYSYSSLPI